MAIQAKSMSDTIQQWTGMSIEDGKNPHYPFSLRVVVAVDIPPRHPLFNWVRGMGVSKMDEIFNGTGFAGIRDYMLGFPERWLSVKEQSGLMLAITKHPELKKLRSLDIITSSAMIISDMPGMVVRTISMENNPHLQNFEGEYW